MIHLKQAVVVEGKYDKIKLSSILDATILQTNGFRIFQDAEKVALLRELAKRTGLVVLTDSDAAGFRIRNYLKGCIREGRIYHAYIPEVLGKEKRKAKPSAAGMLGVEGVPAQAIRKALERAGISAGEGPRLRPVTKADFVQDGLSGAGGSQQRRVELLRQLDLPRYLSANSLLEIINTLYTYDEYKQLVYNLKMREDVEEGSAPK